MSDSPPLPSRSVLDAVAFAARAHRSQMRKDKETPYASHVFRVCLVVRHAFGIDDEHVLTAAVLHDTIEDTTTDFDDVEEHFGRQVAEWVALLSKDKRLPESEREKAYCDGLASAPWQVKLCKLGDIYDNLTDADHFPPQRQRAMRNAERYLNALATNMHDSVRPAWDKVSALLNRLRKEWN